MTSLPKPRFFSRASSSQVHQHSPHFLQRYSSAADSASFIGGDNSVDERHGLQPSRPPSGQQSQPQQQTRQQQQQQQQQNQQRQPELQPKKKGLKGFLQKIGGAGKKKTREGMERDGTDRSSSRAEDDYSSPLPPPPSLSMLVEGSDRRKQSRSPPNANIPSSSNHHHVSQGQLPAEVAVLTTTPQHSPQLMMDPTTGQGQYRSVSAPVIYSPSRSSFPNSTSPTSSRFPYRREVSNQSMNQQGYSRDSFASSATSRRMSSVQNQHGQVVDAPPPVDRRMESTVEVLEGDEGRSFRQSGWAEDGAHYSDSRFSQGALGSLTNSSGTLLAPSIETPPINGPIPHTGGGGDQQKTLPPLPPLHADQGAQDYYGRSPDSFNAFLPDNASSHRQVLGGGGGGAHARTSSGGQISLASQFSNFAAGISTPGSGGGHGDGESQRARKTRSKFGLKGLFTGGGKRKQDTRAAVESTMDQGGPYLASTHSSIASQYNNNSNNNSNSYPNDSEYLSRVRSAGPNWGKGQGGYAPHPEPNPMGRVPRPLQQPVDERARRTFYQ